jgi:hypothetical protein
MARKWNKYEIDYEYGIAHVWSKKKCKDPLQTLSVLAYDCFGIRKSIGKTALLKESKEEMTGEVETPMNDVKQLKSLRCGQGPSIILDTLLSATNFNRSVSIPKDVLKKTEYILAHSGGDVIVFDAEKEKLVSEWDD